MSLPPRVADWGDEVRAFVPGGIVGGLVRIDIERVGQCAAGHCLYRIEGVTQHIAPSSEIGAGDTAQLTCPHITPRPHDG